MQLLCNSYSKPSTKPAHSVKVAVPSLLILRKHFLPEKSLSQLHKLFPFLQPTPGSLKPAHHLPPPPHTHTHWGTSTLGRHHSTRARKTHVPANPAPFHTPRKRHPLSHTPHATAHPPSSHPPLTAPRSTHPRSGEPSLPSVPSAPAAAGRGSRKKHGGLRPGLGLADRLGR